MGIEMGIKMGMKITIVLVVAVVVVGGVRSGNLRSSDRVGYHNMPQMLLHLTGNCFSYLCWCGINPLPTVLRDLHLMLVDGCVPVNIGLMLIVNGLFVKCVPDIPDL